ncbi:hypothetical protein ACQ86N_13240 [Puia sp. P3]|uniref:hypothetical protein n=1 Tax=Puia sp. P3 TaxID=3423952 RepID=UPI003D67A7ED
MTAGIDEGMAGVDKGSAGVEGVKVLQGWRVPPGPNVLPGWRAMLRRLMLQMGCPGGWSPAGGEESLSERERNRMYKGILWMKEKYEQYRDLADRRIEQLKDELVRSEQRYRDLLDQRVEGRAPGVPPPPGSVSGEEAAPADAQAGTPLAVEALAPSPVDPISPGPGGRTGETVRGKGAANSRKRPGTSGQRSAP